MTDSTSVAESRNNGGVRAESVADMGCFVAVVLHFVAQCCSLVWWMRAGWELLAMRMAVFELAQYFGLL